MSIVLSTSVVEGSQQMVVGPMHRSDWSPCKKCNGRRGYTSVRTKLKTSEWKKCEQCRGKGGYIEQGGAPPAP